MCGICGIVYPSGANVPADRPLLDMRDILTHRGPDDAGLYRGPGIALGSRRLAILDLSPRGRMPMSTPDGRYHIVYNGEVYNFRELRKFLESKGCEFQSDTDTEVILRLYEVLGPEMLQRLNGMFAFAIWDAQARTLFAARDRMGIKPFYYAEYRNVLYFASEEKALFAAGVPASFDRDVWEELLCFRYVAGERTPFAGVKRLLPGHSLSWQDGRVRTARWWNLAERAEALRAKRRSGDATEWFGEIFDSSVGLRRISDVPVGVLLSGGLDSSSIAASLATQAGDGVHSFTVRFDEEGYDEGPLARRVADRWLLNAHELQLTPDDLRERYGYASWLNDEPLAHGSDVHLWAIAEAAKPHVTVLLSGEGADECLGGYVRYRPLLHPSLLAPARAVLPLVASRITQNGRARKLTRFLKLKSVRDVVLFNACDVLPEDLKRVGLTSVAQFPFRERVLHEAEGLYPNDPMRQAMYSDQHTFLCSLLDRNDRMTMGASIECRVPFLDYRLVEGLASLPTNEFAAGKDSKRLLRRSIGGRLPDQVLRFRKWGFGVPWRKYLRDIPAMRELIVHLPEHELIREGILQPRAVRSLVTEFLGGDDTAEPLVKELLAVTAWHDACCGSRHGRRPDSLPLAVG
jgi:asparagine synthase (glutamine-hydrolysing)